MNSNKLIADFMDLETPDGVYYECLTKEGHRSELTHFMLLEYHTSWDWLMPVADKCLSQSDDTMLEQWSRVHESLVMCDINVVYCAVVDFISYNKYPFNEGDDYWVLEDGELVWGVWDDASEEMHDENPYRKYFTNEQAMEFAKTWGIKYNK